MRSTVVALACTVAGTLGLLSLPAAAARADSPATLPQLTSFHQIVVDSANGYVFLSEGTTSLALNNGADTASAVVVTDLAGNYITTLDGGDGVEGLALSSDGNTLYAALAATDQVAAIDAASGAITSTTTTPTQTLYDLGTGNVPYGVALQSGEIWVSYIANPPTVGAGGFGAIGAIDPTSTTFTAGTASGTSGWTSPPDLAADPSDSNVLVAAQPGTEPVQGATFNTTGGSATVLATQGFLGAGTTDSCDFENQIAVVPGGSQFVAACVSPPDAIVYSTANLAPTGGSYVGPSTISPNAVAVNPSGTLAAGFGGANPAVIETFALSGTNILQTLTLPAGATLADAGLAWSADGSQLFAVTKDNTTGDFSLSVFSSLLTLTGSSSAAAGQSLTLNGSLTLVSGAALPSGSTVSVTRSGPDGTVSLPAAQPSSDGSFTITDTPTEPGAYTYTATYAGDPGVTQPATATFQVTVAVNGSTITLTNPGIVNFGANVTVAGKLSLSTGTTPAGTTVTIVRTEAGSTATKTFSASTGTGGSFTVTDSRPAIGKYTYTATYAGNASNASAKATLTVSVERTTPSLTIKTSAANVNYGKSVTITATLGPTQADRWVGIYAGPANQARKLLKLAKVNAQGNLSVSYTLSRDTTFFAEFSGDSFNGPRTVSVGVGVYVLVYMSPSGYFKTVKIGATTYQVYHHTALLHTYSRVVPDKAGECIKLEVQQYSNGWLANTTFGCFTLNKSSVFVTNIGLTQAAGALYRIRTDYIRGKDGNNLSTDGGWVYFEVVN